MLHKILHKSNQVNYMDVVELSQRTGLVDITNKGYKVKPVFQVDVVDKQLIQGHQRNIYIMSQERYHYQIS